MQPRPSHRDRSARPQALPHTEAARVVCADLHGKACQDNAKNIISTPPFWNVTMSRTSFTLIGCLTACLLSGCLVPEQFKAAANIRADGSFIYRYEGTAMHALAAAQIAEHGSLSAKDEASLRQGAEKEAAKPGVKKFEYLGNARFRVELERENRSGKASNSLDLISVRQNKDGSFTVSSPVLKEKEQKALAQLGILPAGVISVTLPAAAHVISHNASSTPGIFDKSYAWKVSSFAQKLELRYRLAN